MVCLQAPVLPFVFEQATCRFELEATKPADMRALCFVGAQVIQHVTQFFGWVLALEANQKLIEAGCSLIVVPSYSEIPALCQLVFIVSVEILMVVI